MLTLILDTSTEKGLVAICEGNSLLYHRKLPFGLQNSKYLLPSIEEAFDHLQKEISHLTQIVVGVGPGSYTGIRVAASVAKSFAYACEIPLHGVSTLYGLIPQQNGPFTALIDARIGGAYFLKGEKKGETITYYSEPAVCPLIMLEELKETIFVTPYQSLLETRLKTQFPNMQFLWEETTLCPIQLLINRKQDFEIMYLRQTQAEIDRMKTG